MAWLGEKDPEKGLARLTRLDSTGFSTKRVKGQPRASDIILLPFRLAFVAFATFFLTRQASGPIRLAGYVVHVTIAWQLSRLPADVDERMSSSSLFRVGGVPVDLLIRVRAVNISTATYVLW